MKARGFRKADSQGRSEGQSRFVQLPYWLMETPAFHLMSPDAKVALIYILKRFDGRNNGAIGFGVRSGGFVRQHTGQPDAELRDVPVLPKTRMHRALCELEAFGFVAVAKESSFGQKRLSREWRLTWLPCNGAPTKDFARLTFDDCKRIATGLKTKRSPASGTIPPLTVPVAGHGEGERGKIIPLQSRQRDYEALSLSHGRDTSNNHIRGVVSGGDI